MSQVLFCGVELFECIESVWAVIVAAFVNNDIKTDFPAIKRAVAMGTIVFCFSSSFITIIGLKG